MSHTSDRNLLSVNMLHDTYRFTRKLGDGGFSDVFLAEKRVTGEYVAVKMMKITTNDGNERKTDRFRREMSLYSQLDHPNIVKVLDSGETDNGILFIVFEYIKGLNLADLLKKEGALSLHRAMDLMRQVLDGLGEAHAKGIIHRDLKPENIMIITDDTSEKIKILDFGISTFVQGLSNEVNRLTMTREFLGTPVYSAPEQLRGDPVSVKVDIYAWGLILLECITGRSPFSGQTIPAIVQQQLASSPIPLPSAISNHQLGTLLRWTLEKSAERRAGLVPVIISHLETVSIESIPQQNGFLTGDLPDIEPETLPRAIIYNTVSAHQERRQITALCCTIEMQPQQSGSTNDLLDERYQDLMESGKKLVSRFGAYITHDSGDRIFAYFGFPDASDTDPRRAARSALELANIFSKHNTLFTKQYGIRVTFRIGIHTGTITVRKHSQNPPVLSGIVLNTAGKLCREAQQDSILVSASCFSLLKDSVELIENPEDLNHELYLKEKVYKIIGEKRSDSLLDIFTNNVSPMIGRDGELARLYRAWIATRNGNSSIGKVMLLQGEAGIGKSRLAAEFAKKIAEENGMWLECRCLPEGKNSALHPVLSFLRNQFRIAESYSPKDNCLALEHHLKSFGMDCSIAVPLFGTWLGIATDGYTMPQFSPQKQKEIILQLSSEILAGTAQNSCSILMIEDLHWADPTTIEFLPKLFEQVKRRGVMLCMSARPAFVPSWKSNEAELISLSGLNDEHVEEVVRTILGSEEVGQDTLSKIISRVDGVPLFIEEIVLLMREEKLRKDEIPKTLRDLLTSRIDRLGPARETAQLASVIGREFDYNLIEKVSNKDPATLLADLDHLISAGVIHIQLVVGNPHYVFHHALVRDAAYESIKKQLRKEIHARIAEVLEREFGEVVEGQPEILAWHLAEAVEYEKAVKYGIKTSGKYLVKSLYSETIYHATQSLEWVKNIQDEKIKIETELQLLQLLIPAYISMKGFAAPELGKINSRLDHLRKNLTLKSEVTSAILYGKVIYYQSTPDYEKCNHYLKEALDIAYQKNDTDLLSALYSVKSHLGWSHGTFKESVKNADISLKLYDKRKLINHGTVFGHDSKVLSLGVKALSLTILGDISSADEFMKQSIEFATQINDASSKGLALAYQLCILHERNERMIIKRYCDEFKKFIRKYGLVLWLNVLNLYYSWSTSDIAQAKQCIENFKKIGLGQLWSYWNFIVAQIEYDKELYVDCLKRVELNLKNSFDMGEIYYVPELFRLKSLCLAKIEPENSIEIFNNFNKAYNFAEKIEANIFKLRTLLDFLNSATNTKYKKWCVERLKNDTAILKLFSENQNHFEVKIGMAILS